MGRRRCIRGHASVAVECVLILTTEDSIVVNPLNPALHCDEFQACEQGPVVMLENIIALYAIKGPLVPFW
ncbi:hypothetical protein H671_3g8597 [Cricetulus griseus]|nr:hypothetical protein H671_3g8597 [Cricetulus griseus]